MISISSLLCLAFFGLVACNASRHTLTDRRLSEEDDFYGMPPSHALAQIATESPSALLAAVHHTGNLALTGSTPQSGARQELRPDIKSFMVHSKQPGTGCHQLSSKQPLQLRPSDASINFFRGGSSMSGAAGNQADEPESSITPGSQLLARLQDSQDGSPAPCADLPFNIFAALSRDGYVRHTALNGDQPEF
ncbi:hypothetical protein CVIRNUC_008491 [Coccomyxa viridis]|uniref:Uncharacterized protein n=1 Tax=Coccomyxa viridis TaxID=1274662 RepID=A0AAV1IGZ1_9CHLO|nr:hypothetical protein CVIRNUC_008491 [Coccomyxa viridis]